jgi:aspartyl-tRNA synthetase
MLNDVANRPLELPRTNLTEIPKSVGKTIFFRCRIHGIRPMGALFSPAHLEVIRELSFPGAKLTFVVFRQRMTTVQGVLRATDGNGDVSESMVRWVEKLPRESVVLVEGRVRKAQQEVKATNFHGIEIDILKVRSSTV